MSELMGSAEHELINQEIESRFGDHEHTIEAMRSGDPHLIGSVDELYPDEISSHQNIVEVVQMFKNKYDTKDKSSNMIEPIVIHFGEEKPLFCIFKPFDGENPKTKEDHEMKSFYPRELAGYMISEHFGYDLVPPTTIREVNGRIGALQLFLEPPDYISGEKFFDNHLDQEWEAINQSSDYYSMALFDYQIGNTDRKDANFLVKLDQQRRLQIVNGQPELVAIDHGLTLDTRTFNNYEVMGPLLGLTCDNQNNKKPKAIEIPAELLQKLRHGYEKRDQLDLTFLPDLSEKEINNFWVRTDQLIKTSHFLSPENTRLFTKK